MFSLNNKLHNSISIDGESIVETEPAKLLGVTMDMHLKFTLHIDTLIGKSRAAVHGLLTLKRKGVTPSTLTKYYQACIFPILTYASPAWHSHLSQNSKDKLERHQSLCLKLIHPTMPSYTERLQAVADLDFVKGGSISARSAENFFWLPPSGICSPLFNKMLPLFQVKGSPL